MHLFWNLCRRLNANRLAGALRGQFGKRHSVADSAEDSSPDKLPFIASHAAQPTDLSQCPIVSGCDKNLKTLSHFCLSSVSPVESFGDLSVVGGVGVVVGGVVGGVGGGVGVGGVGGVVGGARRHRSEPPKVAPAFFEPVFEDCAVLWFAAMVEKCAGWLGHSFR